MSHKRHDQLTVSGEWAKHLRPDGRRAFWKAERRAFRAGDPRELLREEPVLPIKAARTSKQMP